jgi:hypothetical protein
VLRRHWRTCKAHVEKGKSIPQPSLAIRKTRRKVCDNCARLKRACNLGLPCGACSAKNQDCSYSEAIASAESALFPGGGGASATTLSHIFPEIFDAPLELSIDNSDNPLSFSKPSTELQTQNVAPAIYSAEKMDFLNRTTALSGTGGIINCFECGSLIQRVAVTKAVWYSPFDLEGVLGLDGSSTSITPSFETDNDNQSIQKILLLDMVSDGYPEVPSVDPGSPRESFIFHWVDYTVDPLMVTTDQIVRRLKGTIPDFSKDGSALFAWSPSTEERCWKFFRPSNIQKFMRLFWCFWYPNCPIIHKPTFCLERTPILLLLPMLIIGACTSADEEDTREVRLWFDVVEKAVFSEDCLQEALTGSSQGHIYSRHELLRALQASFLVCAYQNWEGSNKTKERIRRLRYSMIVAVCILPPLNNIDTKTDHH